MEKPVHDRFPEVRIGENYFLTDEMSRMPETIEISSNDIKTSQCSPYRLHHGHHSGSLAIMCCYRLELVSEPQSCDVLVG
jgi:hypothetical protein